MTPSNQTRSINFRPDVEGLRAVAVLMVLLYHIDVPGISGGFAGVDVFFVISGFLITGLLAREVERTGRISLLDFYARRAKRLFPAAALVLAITAAASWWLLPSTRWSSVGGDIVASAAYFINWRLASRSVDYLAEDVAPSPVQHFWSLAVEEQYYIAWPLLFVMLMPMLGRSFRIRPLLLTVTTLVGLPSLAYSVIHTEASPSTAYFITFTRMWELAIGAAIALTTSHWRKLSGVKANLLGWGGMLAIIASSFLINAGTPWPGYAAALPTLGAAAVIAAGFSATGCGPIRVLGLAPMVWIGGISYSLYLWHWPLIQFAKAYFGTGDLPPIHRFIIVTISAALAWATLKLVENPIRNSKRMHEYPRYALSTGLNFTLLGISSGLVLLLMTGNQAGISAAALTARMTGSSPGIQGAAVIKIDGGSDPALLPVDHVGEFLPTPETATTDVPDAYNRGCQLGFESTQPKTCISGVVGGSKKVALLGDSKAMQWLPALQLIAHRHDWEIQINTKSSCGFHDRDQKGRDGNPYSECAEWNRLLLPRILHEQQPDIAFVSMGGGSTHENAEEIDSLKRQWKTLIDAGIRVVAIANNPHPGKNIYECVARNKEKLTVCSFPRRAAPATASMRVAAMEVSATFIDLNDHICAKAVCAPIVGNVLIYRQGSHITRTYAASLAPKLESELERAGLFGPRQRSPSRGLPTSTSRSVDSGQHYVANVLIPKTYRIVFDRTRPDKNSTVTRRIKFSYKGKSRDEVFKESIAAFRDQGFVEGRISERNDGSIATNFRNDAGQVMAFSVTPAAALDGTGFLSIPQKKRQ